MAEGLLDEEQSTLKSEAGVGCMTGWMGGQVDRWAAVQIGIVNLERSNEQFFTPESPVTRCFGSHSWYREAKKAEWLMRTLFDTGSDTNPD